MYSLMGAGNNRYGVVADCKRVTAWRSAPATAGFVALSRFVVATGMEAEVNAAFRERSHLVDGMTGFVRMEVLCQSHRSILKDLKLVDRETCISEFEVVCV